MENNKSSKKQLVHSILMFLILIVYIVFINVAFVVWLHINNIHLSLVMQIIAGQVLSFFIPFIIYLAIKKQSINQVLLLNPLDVKNFILIFFITISSLPLAAFISSVTSLFMENAAAHILIPATDTYQLNLLVLAIGVTPAILEEIIFRGVFYKELNKLPHFVSALIGGLFFGIVHLNLQQFFYAFALGILFAYFVHYTKSIWAPILSHFLINTINVVAMYFQINSQDVQLDIDPIEMGLAPVITIGIFAIIFSPFLIFLMRLLKKHNDKKITS